MVISLAAWQSKWQEKKIFFFLNVKSTGPDSLLLLTLLKVWVLLTSVQQHKLFAAPYPARGLEQPCAGWLGPGVQPTRAGDGLVWVADAAGGSAKEMGWEAVPCGGGAWGKECHQRCRCSSCLAADSWQGITITGCTAGRTSGSAKALNFKLCILGKKRGLDLVAFFKIEDT